MVKFIITILGIIIAGSSLASARANDSGTILQRAQQLEKTGQNKDSIPLYLEALRVDPQNFDVNLGLGRSYYALGDDEKAGLAFRRRFSFGLAIRKLSTGGLVRHLQQMQPQKVLDLVKQAGGGTANSVFNAPPAGEGL